MRAILNGPTIVDQFDETKTYPAGTQFEVDVLDEDADYGWHHTFLFMEAQSLASFLFIEEARGHYITRAQSFVPLAAYAAQLKEAA